MKYRFFQFFLIFIFAAQFVQANNHANTINKAKQLLIYDEQVVPTLRLLITDLQQSYTNSDKSKTAESIYWIAEALFKARQLSQLEKVFETCSSFVEKNNQQAYIQFQLVYAKFLITKGKYDECISMLKQQLNKNEITLHLKCATQLVLADAYQRIQIIEKSKASFDYVLHNAIDTISIAKAYNGIGSCYYLQTEYDSALLNYNKSLRLLQQTVGENHTLCAQVYYNLGLVADLKIDYELEEKYLTKSLEINIKKNGNNNPMTANAYGALGSLFYMKDDPEKALYYSLKEENILKKIYGNNCPDLVYCYLNIGKNYSLLKQYTEAEKYLLSTIELIKKYFGIQHNLYKQAVVELAVVWTAQHKQEKSVQLLQATKLLNEDEFLGDVYVQSGEILLSQNKLDDAISDFNKAHQLFIKHYGEKNIYSIDALNGLSNVYLKLNQVEKANELALQALAMTIENKQIIYPYDNWICTVQLLKCKQERYQQLPPNIASVQLAIAEIKAALNVANTIKHTLYTVGSQGYYNEKMAILNQLGINFLTTWYPKRDTYFFDNLLFFAENNKANLLRSKIITYQTREILPIDERKKADFITNKLNHFYGLREDNASNTNSINDSILFYNNIFEKFSQNIEQKYPKIYYLKYNNKRINIQRIQQEIKAKQTFLAYLKDDENYYCLAIDATSKMYFKCGTIATIDSLINDVQNSILQKNYHKNTAKILAEKLLPKTLNAQLIISPAGQLYQLAFDALQQNNQFLLQQYSTQYAFSAGLYFLNRFPVENKSLLAIFPNYQNSHFSSLSLDNEKKILSNFKQKDMLTNKISLALIKQKMATAGIIHIGAHLQIDTTIPLRSAIIIQPNTSSQLTINDIWKLQTNAQLATLATCKSNFGQQQTGEGIKNFAWAFHYAGVRNILSTQWNTSDKSTSKIMQQFYQQLKSGKSEAEALQYAKLAYLNSTDKIGAQPFYWSNFYIYGDDSTVDITPYFLVTFWWIPILVFLFGYWAISYIRRNYMTKQYKNW